MSVGDTTTSTKKKSLDSSNNDTNNNNNSLQVKYENIYPKIPRSSESQYLYDFFHRDKSSDNDKSNNETLQPHQPINQQSQQLLQQSHQQPSSTFQPQIRQPKYDYAMFNYYNNASLYHQQIAAQAQAQAQAAQCKVQNMQKQTYSSPSPTSDSSSPHTPHNPNLNPQSIYPSLYPTIQQQQNYNINDYYHNNKVPEPKIGQKRGIDSISMEELVEDLMRKKKQGTMFDDKLCDRLNAMYEYTNVPYTVTAATTRTNASNNQNIPPSINNLNYNINTTEELNDVNSLLMQLGKEAASTSSPTSSEDLFDTATLVSLGLSPSDSQSDISLNVPSPPPSATNTLFPAIDSNLYPQLEKRTKVDNDLYNHDQSTPYLDIGNRGNQTLNPHQLYPVNNKNKKISLTNVPALTKAKPVSSNIYGLLDEKMEVDDTKNDKKENKEEEEEEESTDNKNEIKIEVEETEDDNLTLPPILKAPPSPPSDKKSLSLSPSQIAGALSPKHFINKRRSLSSCSNHSSTSNTSDNFNGSLSGLDALAIAATTDRNNVSSIDIERKRKCIHVIKALLFTINNDFKQKRF